MPTPLRLAPLSAVTLCRAFREELEHSHRLRGQVEAALSDDVEQHYDRIGALLGDALASGLPVDEGHDGAELSESLQGVTTTLRPSAEGAYRELLTRYESVAIRRRAVDALRRGARAADERVLRRSISVVK